jgi:hypothetical protein
VSAGDAHTCALLDNGTVRCWGFSADGQLGYGSTTTVGDDESPASVGPVNLGVGRAATAIAAGSYHTCAVLDDGHVRCWGSTFYGQVGYPRTSTIGDDEAPGAVGPLDLGTGRTATAITAGARHTCALLDGGDVRCWGDADNGQLGYGNINRIGDDEAPGSVGPVDLGAARTARAITAGAYHTCALLDTGAVRCWGYGLNGQLGYGNTASVGDDETPASVGTVDLGPGRTATAISAGDFHTCALLDDGTVRCWGEGAGGRLGYGNTNTIGDNETPGSVGPVNLGAAGHALAVSAGGAHTCARLDEGTVTCWGDGGNGRLGYCNERSIGDDEFPASVGAVPLALAAHAPSNAYSGCARQAGAVVPRTPSPAAGNPPSPTALEALRRRGYRSCLMSAARHAREEIRRARRISGRSRERLRRHATRHRSRRKRACVVRFGRTPGRVRDLKARAGGRGRVTLYFEAAGTDGNRGPAARSYVVKQSRRPIRGARGFRRAQTLCHGHCRFPSVSVGRRLSLIVTDLRSRAHYYYAVAARDNVTGRRGPPSLTAKVMPR